MKIFRLPALTAFAAAMMAGLTPAMAETLSPAAALDRALQTESGRRMAPASTRHMHLVYTETTATKLPAVYVFGTNSDGYVLVSADDCVEAGLLGYSDSGKFDPEAMAPAMSWWLSEYARQIEYAASNPTAKVLSPARASEAREPIEPMVSTRWNQSAPYNDECPMVNGKRAVTGCVATALAQVMKYHNWPPQGKGSNSYMNSADYQTISMDFSKVKFDWDNMLDVYTGNATAEQKAAVATLMHACGVGVDMTYTAVESGAPDVKAAYAMVNYFNYDKGIRFYIRDYYGIEEWEEIVYEQLKKGPVQYSGSTANGGGHSFVCDGYSSDGYFHMNWGWGGMSDGYFKLTALNPDTQGIGGSTAGYNWLQSIIGEVKKLTTGSRVYENLVMPSGFGISNKTASAGSAISVVGLLANYTINPLSMTLTVKITNDETGEVDYCTGTRYENMPFSSGLNGWTAYLPSKLADGNYTLTPAFINTLSQFKDIPVCMNTPQYATMSVNKGICTFGEPTLTNLRSTDLKVLSPIYSGQLFKLSAKVTNPGPGEFYGKVVPMLATKDNKTYAIGQSQVLDLLEGESIDFDYTGAFLTFTSAVEAGSYTLYLVNEATNVVLGEGVEVEFLGDAGTPKLSMNSFTMEGDRNNADKNHLVFNGVVKCTEGYFASNLQVVIFPMAEPGTNVQALAAITSKPVFVAEDGTATLSAQGAFAAGEPGKEYFAVVFNGQTQVSSAQQHIIFTIGETSGVDNVAAGETYNVFPNPTYGMVNIDGTAAMARVFNTAGAEVMRAEQTSQLDLSTLAKGIYMVEIIPADGSERVVRRVIRK